MGTKNQRFFALDTARAWMMLLGVLLHAITQVSFFVTPKANGEFGWVRATYDIIHSFRMPAFMLAAGFFAALIWQRYGRADFLRNRARRILLPFAAALVVLSLVNAPLTRSLVGKFPEARVRPDSGFLWFLFYLFIYAFAAVMIDRFAQRSNLLQRVSTSKLVEWLLATPFRLAFAWVPALVFAMVPEVLRNPVMLNSPGGPFNLVPVFWLHAFCFASGWLLYQRREIALVELKRLWWAAGLIGFSCFSFAFLNRAAETNLGAIKVIYLLGTFYLLQFVLGVALRFFDKPNRVLGYLSQASYWMYLVHIPVIWLLILGFARTGGAFTPTVLFITVLTFAIGLISYQLLVRKTFVGQFLNGRRF